MTLPNLNALESEWAVFMENKTGNRNGWTQDQRWRSDNPGEFAKLLAYRDAGGERPVLTSEPGRRMVFHVDAYLLAKEQVDPEPEPTAPVDWVHDYTAARGQATPPDYGWNWGMQYTSGTPQTYFNLIPDGISPGVPAARLRIPASAANPSLEGLYKWPYKIGEHKFYGQMVKFPTGWQKPSGAGWGAAINQLGYQGLVNSTLGTFAHADHCQFVILTGEQKWPSGTPGSGTVVREFNNSEEGGTWPSAPRIIPAPMQLGVWHQLIMEVRWSTCSTKSAHYADVGNVSGLVRCWHRVKGQAAWVKTVEYLDIPTLQWGYGINGPTHYWSWNMAGSYGSHKFGIYSGPASFVRELEHGNICQGPSFDSVARQLG